MGHIIDASELAVGDVYRPVRGELYPTVVDTAFAVTGRRTVRYAETYNVIEAVNVKTGNRAEINLRTGVLVSRLEQQSLADLKGYLDVMEGGASINIVRYDDRFWC